MTPTILLHSVSAIAAALLGLGLLLAPKGTPWHVGVGWVYVLLLVVVSVSGMFIQRIRSGQYSFIHLFVPFTLLSLLYALVSIRRYKKMDNVVYRKIHMRAMMGVYVGGLLLGGALTLSPGRIFYRLLFQ